MTLKTISIYCISALMLLKAQDEKTSEGTPPSRPNVLFIIADDMNVDLAAYGNEQIKTPHLDRLRKRSMVFNRAYVQYPLCNPSRNSFLTGMYPGTTGSLRNDLNIRDTAPDVTTLPEIFKNQGYRTISTGKVFHQEDPGSWSQISDLETGGLCPLDQEPKFYHHSNRGSERKSKGDGRKLVDDTVPWLEWRSVTEGEKHLKDGLVAKATVNRINEIVEDETPFFLSVGFYRPHDPFFAPKRFFDMYPLQSLTLPVIPENASELPKHAFYHVFKKAFEQMGELEKLEMMRSYYAGISYMDEQLGVVLDHFEKKGLMDNTVIVFIGDNGFQVGEKDYWNKGLLFERSCRAPLLISTPEMKLAGSMCDRVVEFVDIYPTLTSLCQIENPSGLDGESLAPLLDDPSLPRKEIAYSYCNNDRSVRDTRFRYSTWDKGGHALYDHMLDPDEHYNLADQPEYSAVLKRMQGHIDAMPEIRKRKKLR